MNEREQLLNAVTESVEQALLNLGHDDATIRDIVKAITSGVAGGTADRNMANDVLKDMSYLTQPWVNPFYNED